MTRCAFALTILLVTMQSPSRETWYEKALRRINPDNVDFGSRWEERKRAILDQLGNRYFQYGLGTTAAIVVLLTVTCVQRVSHKRALDLAARSIADVLRHDEYSRKAAREAIRRYNEHIEACNRIIEASQDGPSKSLSDAESELQHVRKELADTREENKTLRNELAKKQKIIAGMTPRETPVQDSQTQPVQTEMEFSPAPYIERINTLEKQLRAEQRKNQNVKGTSVNDRRA
jgi:septal ring factor EnvC (AmiA/AmiB activator)